MGQYKEEVIEFITQSNLIESVGEEGLGDSLKAYSYLQDVKWPLTKKHILKVHKLVMQNLNPRIVGEFRTCNVSVSSKHCPDHTEVYPMMTAWIDTINWKPDDNFLRNRKVAKLAKDVHIDFECIHPFEDGNGRVGRLLYAWHSKQLGLPLKIFK